MNKKDFKPPKNKNDLTAHLAGIIKNQKVSIFIDAANLYFAGSQASMRIDYTQLHGWFSSKCELINLNYYTAFDPEDKKQEEFLDKLAKNGSRIIKKPIKIFQDMIKGNMDIELAVDALSQKDDYDVLVLISGDGDFTYLIKALEKEGKKSIVLGIGGFTSYELHQEADNYFFLNRISKVWQTPKKDNTSDSEEIDHSAQEKINKIVKTQAQIINEPLQSGETKSAEKNNTLTTNQPINHTQSKKKFQPKISPKQQNSNDSSAEKIPVKLKVGKQPKIFLS